MVAAVMIVVPVVRGLTTPLATVATAVLVEDQRMDLFVAVVGWNVAARVVGVPISTETDAGREIPVTGTAGFC